MTDDSTKEANRYLKAEHLAHWYFRLNGFLTINNLILHPDDGTSNKRTDADIIGVRFPFRRELQFEDDEIFASQTKPHFVIAEIKNSECILNGPWTKPEKKNMEYVLRTIGDIEDINGKRIDEIAAELYKTYRFEDEQRKIELIAFGAWKNQEYLESKPSLNQIEFHSAAQFIFNRFTKYPDPKADHKEWDNAGHELWNLARAHSNNEKAFVEAALKNFHVNEGWQNNCQRS